MRPHFTLTRVVAPALLAVTLLTGCGSTTEDPGVATANGTTNPTASPTASRDAEDAMLEFARCMRANGVDMPDPSGDGPIKIGPEDGQEPTDRATLDKARKACEKHLPDVGGADDRPDPKMQDRMLKFATCMREHGVDMPDPEFRGGGGSFPLPDNADSEEFKAAQEACKQYFGPPDGAGVEGSS
jgi:hypothetical protein